MPLGRPAGCQWGLGGDAAEGQRFLRHPDDPGGAVDELDILGRDLQILGRDRADLFGDQARGLADGVDHHRGKPVRIVPRRERPCAGQRVDFGHHVDVVRRQPEPVGDHLRGDRGVALPGRCGDRLDGHRSGRVDGDRAGPEAARTAAGAGAFLRRLRQGDIGHVGARRFDRRGQPEAEQPALGLRPVALGAQVFVAGEFQGLVETRLIVAGVVERSGRRAVGEGIARDEIAPPDLGDIDAERAGAGIHRPFERKEELGPAISAVEADRQPVGHHQPVVDEKCSRPP